MKTNDKSFVAPHPEDGALILACENLGFRLEARSDEDDAILPLDDDENAEDFEPKIVRR